MLKKRTAVFYLFGKGTAILRGPTFQHIQDIDVFARKGTGLYDLSQKLSGTTNTAPAPIQMDGEQCGTYIPES